MNSDPAQEKSSPTRDFKHLKAENHRSMRSNLLKTMAQVHGVATKKDEDGTVRIKIVVRKEDLRRMLEMIGGGNEETSKASALLSGFSSMLSLEQRLEFVRKRHPKGAEVGKGYGNAWRPVLQSIPEEV